MNCVFYKSKTETLKQHQVPCTSLLMHKDPQVRVFQVLWGNYTLEDLELFWRYLIICIGLRV